MRTTYKNAYEAPFAEDLQVTPYEAVCQLYPPANPNEGYDDDDDENGW